MRRKHPGNPAKIPAWHAYQAEVWEWKRQCEAGMICGFCTDPAIATLVKPSMEPVFHDGQWTRELVHMPVCGPGYCNYGYDKYDK